jgi:chemotaxis protein methyltransferase CheR
MSTEGIIKLEPEEFLLFSDLVYRLFGIHLSDKKKALVHGRLHGQVKKEGFDSFRDYYRAVIADESGRRLLALVDRITTGHTYFFRENAHFQYLKERVFPELARNAGGDGEIRIWCAGCATGEEAYSLAITAKDFLTLNPHYRVRILATDISVSALARAEAGRYPPERTGALPEDLRRRYLRRVEGGAYAVRDEAKELVTFRRLNLMRESFPFARQFHVVFCRNVMIYFDAKTRNRLIAAIHHHMLEGGYLFVGHSEYFYGAEALFNSEHPAVYRKR